MPEARRAVTGPPEADEQYRARALEQLWALRDAELSRAGHSTPAYVAARVVNEVGYPQPLAPMSKFALDQMASSPSGPWARRLASWCDVDRQIVTGVHRAQLLQWLPEVVDGYTTKKQLYVLDGFTDRTSLTYVRELLASEGFEQVCDVHGNAGSAPQPRELYDYYPVYAQARLDAAGQQSVATSVTVPDRVALVLCNRVDGFLATVAASTYGNTGLRVEGVQVFYNVMILDQELFRLGSAGTRGLAADENGDVTMIQRGEIGNMPVWPSGGSLRVGLAALRAFARPIAPWYQGPFVRFGDSSGLLDRVEEILTGLPDWVHDLLGPQLTTPYGLRSNRAA